MKKLTKQSVIFIATFAFTFLLFGGLIIWAALGAKAGEIRIVECQTQLAEDYRRNYLVGETLPTKGVSLVVDGVAEENVTISCDTSSAGIKTATATIDKGESVFVGTFRVNVLAVRHYSMDSAPVLELDGDGNAYVQSMDFKAEVNYIPSEFEVTSKIIMVPENAYDTEIVSYEDNPDVYTLSVKYYGGTLDYNYILLGGRLVNVDMGAVSATFSRSGDGYDVSLGFGGRNFNYRFTRQDGSFDLASGDVGFQVSLSDSGLVSGLYNVLITLGKATKRNLVALVGDSVVWVDSSDRVLTLSNESSTNDKMVLLVTQTETNSSDGANGASGYYLLNGAGGETKLLRFSYYLEGWTSHFTSSSFGEGVSEQQVGDDFTVTYGGVTFKGAAAEWHKAVLNY